jgi:hypothetical protein
MVVPISNGETAQDPLCIAAAAIALPHIYKVLSPILPI